MTITSVLLAIPAVILAIGMILVGSALLISLRRRRSTAGWTATMGTVTGNLDGPDGPTSGRHRFAPTYEFVDSTGTLRLGQADVYGPDQHIVGGPLRVLYNPADPAHSAVPGMPAARGRLAVGLMMVVFGAAGLGMFLQVLP